MGMVAAGARQWHKAVVRAPRWLRVGYILLLSFVARALLPHWMGMRIRNSVEQANFPGDMRFRPRTVIVGSGTRVRLTPHLGEFDGTTLFGRRLDYERGVFCWFERSQADFYELIVEIGANVGVYTVFLDKLASRDGVARSRILAFEPAAEAFRRLQENLTANKVTTVSAFRAAIASEAGFLTFFEPEGHLTNGSFDKEFAGIFSEDVKETLVLACAASSLQPILAGAGKTLLKIDVENYEPVLLAALEEVITRHRPDILLEVLPGTPEGLAGLRFLDGYDRFLILGDGGLERRETLVAEPEHRDWLLQWRV